MNEIVKYTRSIVEMKILKELESGPKTPPRIAENLDYNVTTIYNNLVILLNKKEISHISLRQGYKLRKGEE